MCVTQLLLRKTPRIISFIAAAKSMRRRVIGDIIKMAHAIPLERAQDLAVPGPGVITSLNGDTLIGKNTKFTELQIGGSLEVGNYGEFRIKAIRSDD
jgi:glycerol-3-phosphate O-acyltransferase/dihydroxyacetone phosphate acyltransferase